ncbi:MAG: DMT family transporter [Acidimicrobiia bacterium]
MPFLLAGLSSLTFGVADFLGGLATRRSPAVSVVLLSQLVGGTGVVIAAPIFAAVPGASDFAWGAAAGVAGSVGLVLFYQALATTRIGVTAPVTAVFGTATPVLFGIWDGERPETLAWAGMLLALVAIVFVALPSGEESSDLLGGWRAVSFGAVAGVAFGLFGVFISRTSDTSGLWPIVGARGASVLLLFLVVLALRKPVVPTEARSLSIGAGILDMVANVMFLLAIRRELLSLVAVIMAMYPVSTISLARFVLHERIGRVQASGFALGAIGVTLIVLA